ncbi:hypothetical protein SAMN05444266_10170 [Chitinophaga jiangningensis]|uniref:Uncharacterized protein n=1 Tax=Chitinophaga jiangningensis TaxID=1419482 RepID=A0A1M6V5P1_9BACT|nr:hypothetical protein [Chitinophaga jiangningensis]SHK76606.1 hypothetical protein SAMN05444266_10170 [Chitinophaga jiangningensis]
MHPFKYLCLLSVICSSACTRPELKAATNAPSLPVLIDEQDKRTTIEYDNNLNVSRIIGENTIGVEYTNGRPGTITFNGKPVYLRYNTAGELLEIDWDLVTKNNYDSLVYDSQRRISAIYHLGTFPTVEFLEWQQQNLVAVDEAYMADSVPKYFKTYLYQYDNQPSYYKSLRILGLLDRNKRFYLSAGNVVNTWFNREGAAMPLETFVMDVKYQSNGLRSSWKEEVWDDVNMVTSRQVSVKYR